MTPRMRRRTDSCFLNICMGLKPQGPPPLQQFIHNTVSQPVSTTLWMMECLSFMVTVWAPLICCVCVRETLMAGRIGKTLHGEWNVCRCSWRGNLWRRRKTQIHLRLLLLEQLVPTTASLFQTQQEVPSLGRGRRSKSCEVSAESTLKLLSSNTHLNCAWLQTTQPLIHQRLHDK